MPHSLQCRAHAFSVDIWAPEVLGMQQACPLRSRSNRAYSANEYWLIGITTYKTKIRKASDNESCRRKSGRTARRAEGSRRDGLT